MCRILTLEAHGACPHTHVESVATRQCMDFPIDHHTPGRADVHHAKFAPRQEMLTAERLATLEFERLDRGHRPTENDAVDVAVNQADFADGKNLFDKEMAAQRLSVVTFDILGVMRVTGFKLHASSLVFLRKSSRCGVNTSSRRPASRQRVPCSAPPGT